MVRLRMMVRGRMLGRGFVVDLLKGLEDRREKGAGLILIFLEFGGMAGRRCGRGGALVM